MEANPCKCGSSNLKPKFNSETGECWVHCDDCGNVSTPVMRPKSDEQIIAKWDEENPK